MGIDVDELKIRNKRILEQAARPVTQPTPSERRASGMSNFLFGVIRSVPDANAPYVNVQQVRPAEDYETTGKMEFVTGSLRPVLCEPNTAGGDYAQWIDDSPEDEWTAASVVHWLAMAHGALWIIHKGRLQYITETGEHTPTDCYIWGA